MKPESHEPVSENVIRPPRRQESPAEAGVLGKLVAQGTVHRQAIESFRSLAPDDIEYFFTATAGLKFSAQAQRELAGWLAEIGERDRTSCKSIFEQTGIREILSNTRLNAPQKIGHLHAAVFRMRFPRYSAAIDAWEHSVSAAAPGGPPVRFIPSAGFEKNRLEVTVTVHDPPSAKKVFARLAGITEDQWKELIHPEQ